MAPLAVVIGLYVGQTIIIDERSVARDQKSQIRMRNKDRIIMDNVENVPRSSPGLTPTARVRGLRFVAKHKRELDGSFAAGFCGA